MVKLASGALRSADGDTHTNTTGQCVKDTEEGLGLVVGSVLVDGDEDIVVAENGGYAEKGSEEIRDDVE